MGLGGQISIRNLAFEFRVKAYFLQTDKSKNGGEDCGLHVPDRVAKNGKPDAGPFSLTPGSIEGGSEDADAKIYKTWELLLG